MHPWKFKVGLALGGGAARGLAHIGVLRAMEREKIPIHILTGTSMGAIIGGAYAATRDIAGLEQRVRGVLTSDQFRRNKLSFLRETRQQQGGLLFSVTNLIKRGIFFGVSNLRPSFLSAEEFAGSMAAIVPDVSIDGLSIPFGAVALDIESAREVLLRKGNLRTAVAASSAIPGILPPVRLNGRLLIDGGWVDKIPVLPAFKMGADVVIGVDITAALEEPNGYDRGVNIMVRANAIKDAALVRFASRMADLVIRPEVSRVHWADFGAFERCIEAGDRATTRLADKIREVLRNARLLSFVRPRLGKRLADLYLQSEGSAIAVE